jgi:hypothetical protein
VTIIAIGALAAVLRTIKFNDEATFGPEEVDCRGLKGYVLHAHIERKFWRKFFIVCNQVEESLFDYALWMRPAKDGRKNNFDGSWMAVRYMLRYFLKNRGTGGQSLDEA